MSGRDKQFPDRGDAGWEIDDGPFVAGPGQDGPDFHGGYGWGMDGVNGAGWEPNMDGYGQAQNGMEGYGQGEPAGWNSEMDGYGMDLDGYSEEGLEDVELEGDLPARGKGKGRSPRGRASGRRKSRGNGQRPPRRPAGKDGNGGPSRPKRAQGRNGRGKRRPQRDSRTPVAAAVIFIAAVLLIALLSAAIKKYSPSKERADLNEYYNVHSPEDIAVLLDGQLLEETAKYWDGHVYMDYKLVQQYLNQRFYWDSNENILRYVTDSDVVSASAGSRDYTVTKKTEHTDYTIVKVDGEDRKSVV